MIPISDANRAHSAPFLNYAFIGLNVLVFLYQLYLSGQTYIGPFSELDRIIWEWGNVPPCTFDALGWDQGYIATTQACARQPSPSLTPLTAMFMHVGWLHLLGNMLFLWIFGDNVEASMGHLRYLAFYLVVGLVAAFAHGVVNLDSTTPAIGASGAVAGVMGAYIVLFPRATVIAIVPPLVFLPLPVPAFIVIGLWFLVELVRGFASLGPDVSGVGGGIAYFAHIGGFVAGVVLIPILARRPDRRRMHPG